MTQHATWRSVRMQERAFVAQLHRQHPLRLHGWAMGLLMLLLMWGVSAGLLQAGISSLALRYALALGVGYVCYLLMLRAWAALFVEERPDAPVDGGFPVDAHGGHGCAPGPSASIPPLESGQGGDFAGGGASGHFEVDPQASAEASAALTEGVGQGLAKAVGAVGEADEGALIVVPVLAVFALGLGLVLSAGSLVLVYFGAEALLAVAMEVAFSYVAVRTAVRVTREGWLSAAVRLTWKPLLGALIFATLLGAALDVWVPDAQTLPQALKLLRA